MYIAYVQLWQGQERNVCSRSKKKGGFTVSRKGKNMKSYISDCAGLGSLKGQLEKITSDWEGRQEEVEEHGSMAQLCTAVCEPTIKPQEQSGMKMLGHNARCHLQETGTFQVSRGSSENIFIWLYLFISHAVSSCIAMVIVTLYTCISQSSVNFNWSTTQETGTSRRTHISPVPAGPDWLPGKFRIHFKFILLTYKVLMCI